MNPSKDGPSGVEAVLRAAVGLADPSRVAADQPRGMDSLLAHLARSEGRVPTSAQRNAARRDAAARELVCWTRDEVVGLLAKRGIHPVLLKGTGVDHLYPRPELRPTADLDLLIGARDLDVARRILLDHGWSAIADGSLAEDYLRSEGYCWQARKPHRCVLELHFRLWGSVSDGFERDVLASARPRADGRLVPDGPHAAVVAAAHAWQLQPPRRAADFVDLLFLCRSTDLTGLPAAVARSGQHLPVCLGLDEVARATQDAVALEAVGRLEPLLRSPEHAVLRRLRRDGQDRLGPARIRLAMLRSGRSGRAGLRVLLRRLWAHPAMVERSTSAQRSWPVRRLLDVIRRARRGMPGRGTLGRGG